MNQRTNRLVLFSLLLALGQGLDATEADQVRPWPAYRTILWVGDSFGRHPEQAGLFFQRLREMGINTAMVYGDASPQPLLDHEFPYYVENIVNRGLCLKWNSKVQDWDAFVTAWAKGGRPESAFRRDYCLEDPEWRSWARAQMQQVVRRNQSHQPLAYDIRDELSVTISANPFDYDFNPRSLAAFRDWLQTQYRSLAALNAEWETQFSNWDAVKPFSTDQIKDRMASGAANPRGQPDWQAVQRLQFDLASARKEPTRWNFAPWCDFRTFMDLSLARTLDDLRQTAHALDPHTPVGIEGTQMPHAFGGYDLRRLAKALDWVEPYDVGNAREIFGSFMPGKPIVTTVFEQNANPARRRLWHLLLEGDRGCIVWWSEDCLDWRNDKFEFTPKARALAPVLQEMTSPLAQLFLNARKEFDPIWLYYSQPSIQVDWLLESTVDGSTWYRRFSSHEAEHNRLAKVRNSWLKAFQDLGYSPRFVETDTLATLAKESTGVLVLPTTRALSEAERSAVAGLANRGVRVFADGTPGAFDEHGRLVATNSLESLFSVAGSAERSFVVSQTSSLAASSRAGDIASYAKNRLAGEPDLAWAKWIGDNLPPVAGAVTLPAQARTRVHRYQAGSAQLLAFERNIDYQMSEDLKQAGGNQALEQPIQLEAKLAAPMHVYDLRGVKYLGETNRIVFQLDAWRPSLFALLREKLPEDDLVKRLLSQEQRK